MQGDPQVSCVIWWMVGPFSEIEVQEAEQVWEER